MNSKPAGRLPRLGNRLLADIGPEVGTPGYDRSAVTPGIAHLGVGSFHRAHQAVHVDECLAADPSWGIVGISLQRPAMRDALAPQDFLYTVASRSGAGDRCRVIGSLLDVLVAQEDIDAAIARLADPRIRIVSLTITEKGYCLDAAGERLDLAHADVAADLAAPDRPRSAPGLLVAALKRRQAQGARAFTLLSCDNLHRNGHALRAAVTGFAEQAAPELLPWLAAELVCPCSMVDRIVPKITQHDIDKISAACGYADAWPVVAEPFSQWVIEDRFAQGRPQFAGAAISFVADIGGYELMKLRILNGAHTALAYLGLMAGHATVADAMADTDIAAYVARLTHDELLPTLEAPAGVDLAAYARAVHERIGNPGIRHALTQVAADGSHKLPQRLLPPARERVKRGRSIDLLAAGIAAWIRCWQVASAAGYELADPLAAKLAAAAGSSADAAGAVRAMFALSEVFAPDDHDLFGAPVAGRLEQLAHSNNRVRL